MSNELALVSNGNAKLAGIAAIVDKIFTDRDTYNKFVMFDENKDFFGADNNYMDYIFVINRHYNKIAFSKDECSENDLIWANNYLNNFLSKVYKKFKSAAAYHDVFANYKVKDIGDEELNTMVTDFMETIGYEKDMMEASAKIKNKEEMTEEQQSEAFFLTISNTNYTDITIIRRFFEVAINNENFKYNNNLLIAYTKAMIEKFLDNKGIEVIAHSTEFDPKSTVRGNFTTYSDGTYHININRNLFDNRGDGIARILVTSFHEMRHAVQNQRINNNIQSYDSIQWAKDDLIRKEYGQKYYDDHYKIITKEIDARIAGDIYTLRFLKDVAPQVAINLEKELKESINKNAGYKKVHTRSDGKDEQSLDTLVTNLLLEKPAYLDKYPVLKAEYHENGTRKTTKELMNEIAVAKMDFNDKTISSKEYKDKLKMLRKLVYLRDLNQFEIGDDVKSLIQKDNGFDIVDAERINVVNHVITKNYNNEIARLDKQDKLDFAGPTILNDIDSFNKHLEFKKARFVNDGSERSKMRIDQINNLQIAVDKATLQVLGNLNTRLQKYNYNKVVKDELVEEPTKTI